MEYVHAVHISLIVVLTLVVLGVETLNLLLTKL